MNFAYSREFLVPERTKLQKELLGLVGPQVIVGHQKLGLEVLKGVLVGEAVQLGDAFGGSEELLLVHLQHEEKGENRKHDFFRRRHVEMMGEVLALNGLHSLQGLEGNRLHLHRLL